jgi:sugar/nucleoside kinase (ribokinase family)
MGPTSPAINYLAVGHITKDLHPRGFDLGGTVVFSGLTAAALGRKVGIVTSTEDGLDFSALDGLQIMNHTAPESTVFRNLETPEGRRQRIQSRARDLRLEDIPQSWRRAGIIHLGPVADEIDIEIIRSCQAGMTCVTPQGWFRRWSDDGLVFHHLTPPGIELFSTADAVVLSREDVGEDAGTIATLMDVCKLLIITSGPGEILISADGVTDTLPVPGAAVTDTTGAGDIFAAAFFVKLQEWGDPSRAASFAAQVGSLSVGRRALEGPPTPEEIRQLEAQVTL